MAHSGARASTTDKDDEAAALILDNIRTRCTEMQGGQGNNPILHQQRLDALAWFVCSQEVVDRRLVSAVQRVIGLSAKQQQRQLLQNFESSVICLPRQPHSFGVKARQDTDAIYRWFHEDCPLVEPDKSRDFQYRRKNMMFEGKKRRVECQRNILNGTKREAAVSFSDSAFGKQWMQDNTYMSVQRIQTYICPCITTASVRECSCPVCVEFEYKLKAWHDQRKRWHKTACTCAGCRDPEKFKRYMKASESKNTFRRMICCPREEYAHLALPHLPDDPPAFYRLRCCMVRTIIHVVRAMCTSHFLSCAHRKMTGHLATYLHVENAAGRQNSTTSMTAWSAQMTLPIGWSGSQPTWAAKHAKCLESARALAWSSQVRSCAGIVAASS